MTTFFRGNRDSSIYSLKKDMQEFDILKNVPVNLRNKKGIMDLKPIAKPVVVNHWEEEYVECDLDNVKETIPHKKA